MVLGEAGVGRIPNFAVPLQLIPSCGGWVVDDPRRVAGPYLQTYMGTSLIKKRTLLGPYSGPVPRALWGSQGGGRFLRSKVPLSISAYAATRHWRGRHAVFGRRRRIAAL